MSHFVTHKTVVDWLGLCAHTAGIPCREFKHTIAQVNRCRVRGRTVNHREVLTGKVLGEERGSVVVESLIHML